MHQIHVLIASFSVQIFFTVPFVCFKAISLAEWNKIGADLIVMSPPCQPFCRVGKKRDVEDERSKSFIHFLDILPRFLLQYCKKIPLMLGEFSNSYTASFRFELL